MSHLSPSLLQRNKGGRGGGVYSMKALSVRYELFVKLMDE
jgi:hypothetical protein